MVEIQITYNKMDFLACCLNHILFAYYRSNSFFKVYLKDILWHSVMDEENVALNELHDWHFWHCKC